MFKKLFFFVAVLCCCNLTYAQNVFNPNDALTTYNPNATKGSATNPNIPANGKMTKWVRTSQMSWSTTKFKSYIWNGMAFRMRFPNNYSATNATKYPVIVFFHGGGEIAPVYDNEDQLLWGAQLFEQRINNGEWNGFLIFPQETYIGWDNTYFDRVTSVLDTLQKYNNSDVDRVISMGLSSGGFGSIAYADWYSQRVAATIAASPAQVNALTNDIPGFYQTPLWVANGGTDVNPAPLMVQDFYSAYRNAGGNMYRSYFVKDAHNTWTDMWNMKNDAGVYITTSYWNSAHKAQPVVAYQNATFCTDSAISAKMAVSTGFAAYEWQRNNATISGATSNEYIATQAGTYRVRFKRTASGAWSAWTPNPVVIGTKTCAVDTLFAEHFTANNGYSASSPYSINNFGCQGGIMTSGTEIFTEDATGVLGSRFLVNYTKGGSGCTLASGNTVWKTATPITVRPNTAYEYSFYIGNQTSTSLAQLAPTINGTALITGSAQATGTGNASWKKFTYSWNSGSATTADLGIINRSTATSAGNDFGIDEIAFRPVPIAVPACVTNTSPANNATITTGNTATLKWNAATNATSYSVYLWTGASVPTTPVATVTTTTYNATGLTGSTQYKWYVTPRNANNVPAAGGCSSNQTSFTTSVGAPSCIVNTSPENAAVLTTTTTASLTWPAAATATSYDVYLWKGSTAPTTATANVTTTTYNATALTASSVYNWYIVPKNAAGAATGCATSATNFTTAALPTAPACTNNTSPANGTTVATNTSAVLVWDAVATATSYDVYLAAGTGTPTTLVTNTTALTYSASGLTAGTLYKWYVAPKNSVGAATGCASTMATTFTTAAAQTLLACVNNTAPANATVLPSQTSVRLTWTASAGATSYDVYLSAGNAVPTVLTSNTTDLNYYATSLTAGTLYSWFVAPRNASGANTDCGTTNKSTFTTAASTGGGNAGPVANAGANTAISLPTTSVTLNGGDSYDPDGSIVEFFWYQVQGPVTASMGNFTAYPVISGLTTAGTYVFGLQVKDNSGTPSWSAVTVTVNDAGNIIAGAGSNLRTTAAVSSAAVITADAASTTIVAAPVINPNPVAAGQNALLRLNSVNGGIATVQVLGTTGNLVQTEQINVGPGANTKTIQTGKLRPGLYIVHVTGNVNKASTIKLIVQ